MLTGALLLLSGLGSGYIFSTKVWFPVPESEENVLEMTNIRDLDYREAIERVDGLGSVSYTHLTLPTIYSV